MQDHTTKPAVFASCTGDADCLKAAGDRRFTIISGAGKADRHLSAIQRKLDGWELQHLRELASRQDVQIGQLQAEVAEAQRREAYAEQTSEYWREQVTQLEEQLAPGEAIGLAQDSALSVVQAAATDQLLQLPPAINTPWQGGVYAGVARGAAGQPDHHLILSTTLPPEALTWQAAMDWAASLGEGWALPTKAEAALLYANLREHFDPTRYWTGEQFSAHAAWTQWFDDGLQNITAKGNKGRARAVRRLVIQSLTTS